MDWSVFCLFPKKDLKWSKNTAKGQTVGNKPQEELKRLQIKVPRRVKTSQTSPLIQGPVVNGFLKDGRLLGL